VSSGIAERLERVTVKQLAFDFSTASLRTFDNFVIGRNAELVHHLLMLDGEASNERLVYIWGAPGSGRTHLLRASVARMGTDQKRAAYFACGSDTRLPVADALDAIAIDDVERLGPPGQVDLFTLHNAFRDNGKTLIAAGNAAPMHLALRADVATRLGWGMVYEVHGLTDSEKAQALAEHAAARGFDLNDDVGQYLLTHVRRDMPALLDMLDALDRYSLEEKRAVTVPLLRELLAAAPMSR
jgi:DnaA-homolog protein